MEKMIAEGGPIVDVQGSLERHKYIGRLSWIDKILRKHAHNRVIASVQANLLARNVTGSAETFFAGTHTKEPLRTGFKLVFAAIEKTAEKRSYIEKFQKCGRAREPVGVFRYE